MKLNLLDKRLKLTKSIFAFRHLQSFYFNLLILKEVHLKF